MIEIFPNWKKTTNLGKIQEAEQIHIGCIPKIHGKSHHNQTYKNEK